MATNFNYVSGHPYQLAGSGCSASDVSIMLVNFTDINNNTLAMSDFGTIGYLVLEPKTSKTEIVSFTGVTNNGDGTCTVTGVGRGLKAKSPYDSGGYGQTHSGGSIAIISNPPQFYSHFLDVDNAGTVNQIITFATGATPLITDAPTTSTMAANKGYIDGVAIAGGANASSTVKGISKLSIDPVSGTNPIAVGDNDPRMTLATTSGTGYNSSTNKLVDAADVSAAASSGKIVRATGTALPALSGASLTGVLKSVTAGVSSYDMATASGTQNIAHGLGVTPSYVRVTAVGLGGGTTGNLIFAIGTNSSGNAQIGNNSGTALSYAHSDTSGYLSLIASNTGSTTAIITANATNIVLSWTKSGTPTGTAYLMWEAFV